MERWGQLYLIDCPWNIARIGERCNICRVHDFTQNKVNDFDLHEYAVIPGVILKYSRLVKIYLTEPQTVYDAIVKSMTTYYELKKKQAELKHHNELVDQALKNLD